MNVVTHEGRTRERMECCRANAEPCGYVVRIGLLPLAFPARTHRRVQPSHESLARLGCWHDVRLGVDVRMRLQEVSDVGRDVGRVDNARGEPIERELERHV